ncbi:isopentenyl-diphosphate Delta-isomerase [Tropicimonas isoalkanivorans]|uniref:Isopentenyl-diphosphate Delta-isomerase n=1 Tax=Tropicimonas isoalkanivorans TaxID=441112 RepID=A0A1I1PA40_9RHOB|nr:isopentenyl-diphosphate Delta-isomerase [Tropicimonas isoalkanivorans]SFD06566.1 isopentenyl-diphosphate delta-isomerase [Tropicimonas isoalkanivorans]
MTDEMIPAWVDGTLEPVAKLEVHRRGLRHKAVSVFVMDGENVLLQRRAATKYHSPGLWANTCCTHPKWNESAADCAVRRLREELGITGLYPAYRDRIEYRADVGNGMVEHEVVDVFMAMAERKMKVYPNPEEVAQVEWVGFYDLTAELKRRPERFTPWLRIYLEQYKDRIFGTLMRP